MKRLLTLLLFLPMFVFSQEYFRVENLQVGDTTPVFTTTTQLDSTYMVWILDQATDTVDLVMMLDNDTIFQAIHGLPTQFVFGDIILDSGVVFTLIVDSGSMVELTLVLEKATNYSAVATFSTEDFNIYPNPADAMLNVQYDTTLDIIYEVLSVEGRLVIPQTVLTSLIDVSSLPTGVYFLKMNLNGNVATQRFLKQ